MHFKRSKLKQEFNSKEVSPYLKACTLDLDRYCRHVFGKPMIATCVLRSMEAQTGYCKKGNFKSGFQHCMGEAIDLRTWHLTLEQVKGLLCYCRFELSKICQLKHHQLGTAPHLHLALIGDFSDKAKIWALVRNEGAEEWFVG